MVDHESAATPGAEVAVIIPVRNDAANLEAAVTSVQKQTYEVAEIAIAVGPSDDESMARAQSLSATDERIAVIENPSGKTPTALNMAIAATTAPIIARVDARSVLPDDYVELAVESMSRTGAVNVGGIQSAAGVAPTQRAIAAAMTSRVGVGGARFHVGGGEGEATDTVYLGVFDRKALTDVGGYSESLIRNQDYELNWRLREAGGTVWLDPRLVVEYRPRPTLASLAKQYWQYGRWKREVLKRHPRSLKPRQLAAPIATVAVPVAILAALAGFGWAAIVPLAYVAVITVGAFSAPGNLTLAERATLLAVFPTMHFSWGAGFLAGSPI